MDDEEIISEGTGELMRALGHEVDVASCGEEAIEKYLKAVQAGRPFDIVILDLTIRRGMGGAETLRKLLESDPGVKGIVSSGYSDDIATSNYLAQGFEAFLKKPCNVEELQEALTAILSTPD
ncbi:MAG TPA: response regulator [Thermodesulfovibrionales bacterium]|nr:response regulator [Thermodesulfovibrionales bacterium]